MCVLTSKEPVLPFLLWLPIFVFHALTRYDSLNSKVNQQQLTPWLTVTFSSIIIYSKNKKTLFDLQSSL